MKAIVAVVAGAALLVPAVTAGAAPAGTAYSGKSSIQTKVRFRVADGQVRGFAIGYVAPCDDGEALRGTFRFKPADVEGGRFSVRGPSSGVLPDGRATASQLRLTGRLARGKARGTFSITTQMAAQGGGGVATCRSGRLTWSAAR